MIPSLTTARLTLRPIVLADVYFLYKIFQIKDILKYFPTQKPPQPGDIPVFVKDQEAHWQKHGYGWWGVILKETEQFIGWCGLQFLPETDEVEVGYLTDKAFWGRGLTTEAAKASVQWGFDELQLERIIAIVHPDNIASQRVAQKAGLLFVDENRYFEMDCYRYALTREDYAGKNVFPL